MLRLRECDRRFFADVGGPRQEFSVTLRQASRFKDELPPT
jgi:hypothetical protein